MLAEVSSHNPRDGNQDVGRIWIASEEWMKIAIRQHDRRCCVEFFFICILSPLHFTNTEWGPGMLTVMYQNIIARFRTSNIWRKKKLHRSKITLEKWLFFIFFVNKFYFIYGWLHSVYTHIACTIHSKFEVLMFKKILNG